MTSPSPTPWAPWPISGSALSRTWPMGARRARHPAAGQSLSSRVEQCSRGPVGQAADDPSNSSRCDPTIGVLVHPGGPGRGRPAEPMRHREGQPDQNGHPPRAADAGVQAELSRWRTLAHALPSRVGLIARAVVLLTEGTPRPRSPGPGRGHAARTHHPAGCRLSGQYVPRCPGCFPEREPPRIPVRRERRRRTVCGRPEGYTALVEYDECRPAESRRATSCLRPRPACRPSAASNGT